MKQDEFIKEFNDKLNFNCTSLKEVHLKMYASCTPEDIYHFINHLLSKKPGVSDEEIERMAKEANNIPIDLVIDEEERYYNNFQKCDGFIAGFKKCQSLPPQVVQSEVSCWLIENENQEWHCVREEISKTIGQFGKTVYYNEWTKNPLQAKRFSSKESAEATINVCNLKSCKATEHEFVNSLTPPDAENEAVMFAEWMLEQGCKKWSDDKWEIRKPLNITHTNGTSNYYTTQELFNLYKQGGK